MTLVKYGLIAAAILSFASFVYYRVQTIPEPSKLTISFGKVGAEGVPVQEAAQGPLYRGKVTYEASSDE